jgi:NAD(P)H-flavin reductase
VNPIIKPTKTAWSPATLNNIQQYNHNSFIYHFSLNKENGLDKKEKKKKDKGKKEKAQEQGVDHMDTDMTNKQSRNINVDTIKYFKSLKKFQKSSMWHIDLQSPDLLVSRPYTPITQWKMFTDTLTLQLLIKLYPDGKMSQKLSTAKVGDLFYISAPQKTLSIPFFDGAEKTPKKKGQSSDNTSKTSLPVEIPSYSLLGGGTGITPFFQLLQYAADHYNTHMTTTTTNSSANHSQNHFPKFTLIYSNKTTQDILLHNELQILQEKLPSLKIIHTLTQEHSNTSAGVVEKGRITGDLIKNHGSATMGHSQSIVCGPKGMWEYLYPLLLSEGGFLPPQCTELEA